MPPRPLNTPARRPHLSRPQLCSAIAATALSMGLLAACSTVPASTGPAATSPGGTGATVPTDTGATAPTGTGGSSTATTAPTAQTAPTAPGIVSAALTPPSPIPPLVSPAMPGEGQWSPAGRLVNGSAAVYETTLRAAGSQSVAGIAWMDTSLLAAQLYSGSESPGGGPWQFSAPIQPAAAASLVAAFNGGFKPQATNSGYYTQGRVVIPLVPGDASMVFYRNGSVTVGQWGRDVSLTSDVVGVRQNLNLLVDAGQAVPGLNPADTSVWGATLGGVPNVWRSAVGVTATGALVYVAGSLDITQLASLLVAAGAVRAMELDINPAWTVFAAYAPQPAATLAGSGNGTDLLPGMQQSPSVFFDAAWGRDFVTMSARSGPPIPP